MAVLGKIRSHGVLLLVIVGFALFAFIIGDALTQGSTWFNKSQNVVAEVEGESIDNFKYQALIDQLTEVYRIHNNTAQLTDAMNREVQAQVWENYIVEKLITAEAKKMGLAVSSEELNDRLVRNVHPIIQRLPVFADASGNFSHATLTNFLQTINQNPENVDNEQILRLQNYWMFFENMVKISLLQEKFTAITSKALTANSLDAKQNFDLSQATCNVNYVVQPYFVIPDSTVTVADRDIRDLYSKRREQYKQETLRTLNYVTFNIVPSADDYEQAQQNINQLAAEFKSVEDAMMFAKTNSDIAPSEVPYSEQTVPADFKDFAFAGSTGDATEPVFINDIYRMARIVETGILRPDSVKLRNIFLTPENAGKADSIVDALKKGADFAALATQYSAAPTAANGGEIGWMTEITGMDAETRELLLVAFNTNVNEIVTRKNVNGTQIMQVTEKTPAIKKVQLAILEVKVTPSNLTVSNIFNSAKQFAAELTADEFSTRATESKYQVQTAADLQTTAENIANIGNSRQIIRWAFENKKGKVSDVYECDNCFVVATVTATAEKGYRPYEEIASQLRAELVRDKKADQMSKKIAEELAKNPSLEALGAAIQSEVKTAENVNFSSYQFGAAGYEPKVTGRVIAMEPNKISTPIKGNAGVYVVLPVSKTASALPYDAKMQIEQMNQRLSYLPYGIINDIRSKSNITDNRLKFY